MVDVRVGDENSVDRFDVARRMNAGDDDSGKVDLPFVLFDDFHREVFVPAAVEQKAKVICLQEIRQGSFAVGTGDHLEFEYGRHGHEHAKRNRPYICKE